MEGEHWYLVGQQGLLVHNASVDPAVLYNGLIIPYMSPATRPYQQQGASVECVVASTFMVLRDRGVNVSYADVLKALNPMTQGTKLGPAAAYINTPGLSVTAYNLPTLPFISLLGNVNSGQTAVIALYNSSFGPHALVLDGTLTSGGITYLLIRDPDPQLNPATYGIDQNAFQLHYAAAGGDAIIFI